MAIAVSTTVFAEDTGASSPSNDGTEIVVTARHREESAQKTPIAMSVYDASALKTAGITDLTALTAFAPDVSISAQQGEPIITIRGISSRDYSENGDAAVTVSTDGFYQNRPYALNAAMYDLERVEVLRGPQGTLNGRNSVGGAINILTAKPVDDFKGYFSASYGNYNALNFQGMINVPVNDWLKVRASFMTNSHDGYRDNSPHVNGDAQDDKSGRITFAIDPMENLHGLVTLQYTQQDGAGDVSQNIPYAYNADGSLNHNLPSGINASKFAVGTDSSLRLREKTVRWNFAYDTDPVTITFLGGYDKLDWHHSTDDTNPYSNPSTYAFVQNEYPETTNLELRLTSKHPGPFQWQLGGFYFAENSNLLSWDGAPLADGTQNKYFGFAYNTWSRSKSAYGYASYDITDRLTASGGVRYTSDSKHEDGYYGNLTQNIVYATQVGGSSSSKVTYHAGLDFKATPHNLIYAKFDTGYKAGGFNLGAQSYGPETIQTWEAGSKNTLLGGALQLNVDAYYSNYKNQQVTTFTQVTGSAVALTLNAGASRIWGIEGSAIYKIPVIGTFNATVDYLNARFTDFLSVADPSDPKASGNIQLAGNRPPQAPTLSASIGLKRDFKALGGDFTAGIQSKLQSSSYFSFYNFADTRQGAYTMSDAQVSYTPDGSRWKLTGFVKNLENSVVFTTALQNQYANSYAYQFYPPRTYGFRVEMNW